MFEDIKSAIVKDRYAYFKDFFDNFYNVDVLGPDRISEQAWQASFNVAAGSSPYATYACVDTWLTDFRGDLAKIDVPTLVVHGTEDRILPISATAERLPGLIADLKLVTVEGGPGHTTSPGRTPKRSTTRCSNSSGSTSERTDRPPNPASPLWSFGRHRRPCARAAPAPRGR